MKCLKRISKIQTKTKTVLTQMISVGVVAIIGLFLIEAPASAFSGSGSGTQTDPYQITNATQLQEMADDLAAHYVLMNDIDCSVTATWNSGAGFEPVGDYSNRFTGTFDGQGHKITGLFINRPGISNVGLFGLVEVGAEIKNVGLEDVDITCRGYAGGLVGWSRGTITNCYATGNVNGDYGVVGGLVGQLIEVTITNSYFTGNVSGGDWIGGLVGFNDGAINNSYSTGSVTGNQHVGGLAGVNRGWHSMRHNSTITNSYSTGSVTGISNVGGLVGNLDFGTITNSYSTGSVTGISNVGGLVGRNNNATVSNSYYDTNTSGKSDTGKGEPRTTEEMMQQSTYENWDFDNIWGICEGCSYPYLLWQPPIVDTTPPNIELFEPDPSVLWAPNHKFVEVVILGIAGDICDADLAIDVSVKVIDAEGGDGGPKHEPDYEILAVGIEEGEISILVALRAERSSHGDGRIYEITATVTDDSSNTATDTVDVIVPHDKGKGKGKK